MTGSLHTPRCTCPVCDGRRYNSETTQVKFKGRSIADVLELTASEAFELFANIPPLARKIRILLDVGLDYLSLSRPANTLSGGESQRIRLSSQLGSGLCGECVDICPKGCLKYRFGKAEQRRK
mgnify:CR=1 FL=1